MRRLVVALIFAVAFFAVGCNGQETGNQTEIRRVDDNQPQSFNVDNEPKKSDEVLNVSENTSEPKNTADGSLDNPQGNGSLDNPQGNGTSDNPQGNGTSDNPQGNGTSDNPQGNGTSDNPQGNGTSDNPQGNGTPDNPQGNGTPDNPQGNGTSDNPQGNGTPDNPQGNGTPDNSQGNGTPDNSQGNKTFENTQADKPKAPDNDDQTILLVMAGAIGVLLIIVGVLLYERKRKKEPQSPLNPPQSNPPQPPKPELNSTVVPSQAEPRESNSRQIVLRVGTLRNIGKRKEQQDSLCLSSMQSEQALNAKGLMAVVADGMGGLEGGAAISKIVTDTFSKNYSRQNISSGADFLYESGKAAETMVEKYIERTGIEGGSTLVAVIIRNREMNYISVGDSRIYLLRNGMLKKINREHNYGEVLKAKAARGEVDDNEPYVNPQRHSLTAYIGMGSFHTVDRNQQPRLLEVGDKILLCSDGVYNALGNDALVELLKFNAADAARKIEENILEQNLPKQDNFTGIILELCRKEV